MFNLELREGVLSIKIDINFDFCHSNRKDDLFCSKRWVLNGFQPTWRAI